ncbi:hypothetical protein [Halodesulfovibrio aestuarii]|uniref:Uncharacterized protein n=1 Tax=Halodesulfovibrio aestuarii TaxID=126333 RepID=A0ABV4JWT1_9BACT
MTCLRRNHKRAVYYDEEKKQYIKYFTPKLELKLKYWFRLRKYPGTNFSYIADKLQALGLKTPQVITAEKYKVITQEVEAPTLKEYLQETNDPTIEPRIIELIATILNSGIVFFDFHYENFLYKNGQVYILDLEGYTDSIFKSRGRAGVLFRIEKHLGTHFREEVDKLWKNPTWWQEVIEVFPSYAVKIAH